MKAALLATLGLAIYAAIAPSVQAAVPADARIEIVELLRRIGTSGCEFRRNGFGYDSRRAAQHLQFKFDALAARDAIRSAEEFIDKAATRSSLTGLAYEVRCAGTAAVPSGQWLHEQLSQMRRPDA